MNFAGSIINEFGEVLGRYWFREGMKMYSFSFLGTTRNGYTINGIRQFALRMGCDIWPD